MALFTARNSARTEMRSTFRAGETRVDASTTTIKSCVLLAKPPARRQCHRRSIEADFRAGQAKHGIVLPGDPVHFGRRHASQTSEVAWTGLPSRWAGFNFAAYIASAQAVSNTVTPVGRVIRISSTLPSAETEIWAALRGRVRPRGSADASPTFVHRAPFVTGTHLVSPKEL